METTETQTPVETSLPVWKTPEIVKIEMRRTLFDAGTISDGPNPTLNV